MGTRVSMAGYDTINGASERASKYSDAHIQAYSLYESGMIDMLHQVAIAKLLEVETEENREYTEEHKNLVEKQSEVMRQITDILPEEYKQLTDEVDTLGAQIQMIEMDDQFVQGFIEGYRFLRSLNSSYRSDLLKVRQ